MTILVAATLDAAEWSLWWPLLQAALPDERLVRERSDADAASIDIALVANPPLGALQGLSNLKLIQSLWVGVDKLLADPSVPADVPLARMVDPAMNDAMAETALWAVLGLHRGYFDYAEQQRVGVWQQNALRRADEVTVAILGMGEMGRRCARALTQQGYLVAGWHRADGASALPPLLARADIVLNLLPLTPETRGLFDATTLAQMRRGASLVNLARGAHVVDADLIAALASGQIARAVLDVFETEPLPAAHPYWAHPQVTVLPHIAAPTDPRSATPIAAANVRALRDGQPLANLVDRTRGY